MANYLENTVEDMLSEDYKRRFVAEYHQIDYRTEKLLEMINKYHMGKLSFEPTCPIRLLEKQLKAMKEYRDYLEIRASIEHITFEFE